MDFCHVMMKLLMNYVETQNGGIDMNSNKMKKTAAKMAAWALSGAMCAGSILPAMAEESDTKDTANDNSNSESTQAKVEKTTQKDETVYAKLGADGSQESVIVSDWLKNTEGSSTMDDASDLSDIKNVKGDETYASGNDGSMVWSTSGSDIYYQGNTSKSLPVSVKITYTLDGKTVSADEIAGQSGHVVIRYDFTNNSTQTVEVEGKEYTVNTPFAVVTGMILPNEKFSNVTVSSGKVISDGSKNIVAAMAFPGLEDNLKLSDYEETEDIEIPDYFEVEADVENFELDMTATVVTSDLFEDIDLDSDDLDLSELTDAMDELTDASTQLVNGSQELLDGVKELQSSGTEFFDGIGTLASGAHELADGIATLDSSKGTLVDGVNQINDGALSLKNGAGTLKNGISEYTEAVDALNEGIQAYTAGTDTLANGVTSYVTNAETIYSGASQLADATANLSDQADLLESGMDQVLAGAAQLGGDETIPAQYDAGFDQVLSGVEDVHTAVVTIQSMLGAYTTSSSVSNSADTAAADYTQLVNTLTTMRDNDQSVLDILYNVQGETGTIDTYKSLIPSADLQNKVNGYESDLGTAISKLESNVSAANDAITLLNNLSQLSSVSNAGADTAAQMTALANALSQIEAATNPKSQTQNIYTGISMLKTKTNAMANGNQQLYQGISQLATGVYTLTGQGGEGKLDLLADSISRLNQGCVAISRYDQTLTDGANQLLASSSTLSAGSSQLASNNDTLNSGIGTLEQGTDSLYSGTSSLASGAATLASGIGQLASGSTELASGADTLNNGGSQMSSGIDQLADGASELADGMKEFDEDGIQELADEVTDLTDEVEDVLNRFKAVVTAGQDYQTFTKLSESSEGTVKFILETAAIQNEEE